MPQRGVRAPKHPATCGRAQGLGQGHLHRARGSRPSASSPETPREGPGAAPGGQGPSRHPCPCPDTSLGPGRGHLSTVKPQRWPLPRDRTGTGSAQLSPCKVLTCHPGPGAKHGQGTVWPRRRDVRVSCEQVTARVSVRKPLGGPSAGPRGSPPGTFRRKCLGVGHRAGDRVGVSVPGRGHRATASLPTPFRSLSPVTPNRAPRPVRTQDSTGRGGRRRGETCGRRKQQTPEGRRFGLTRTQAQGQRGQGHGGVRCCWVGVGVGAASADPSLSLPKSKASSRHRAPTRTEGPAPAPPSCFLVNGVSFTEPLPVLLRTPHRCGTQVCRCES